MNLVVCLTILLSRLWTSIDLRREKRVVRRRRTLVAMLLVVPPGDLEDLRLPPLIRVYYFTILNRLRRRRNNRTNITSEATRRIIVEVGMFRTFRLGGCLPLLYRRLFLSISNRGEVGVDLRLRLKCFRSTMDTRLRRMGMVFDLHLDRVYRVRGVRHREGIRDSTKRWVHRLLLRFRLLRNSGRGRGS